MHEALLITLNNESTRRYLGAVDSDIARLARAFNMRKTRKGQPLVNGEDLDLTMTVPVMVDHKLAHTITDLAAEIKRIENSSIADLMIVRSMSARLTHSPIGGITPSSILVNVPPRMTAALIRNPAHALTQGLTKYISRLRQHLDTMRENERQRAQRVKRDADQLADQYNRNLARNVSNLRRLSPGAGKCLGHLVNQIESLDGITDDARKALTESFRVMLKEARLWEDALKEARLEVVRIHSPPGMRPRQW